MVVITPDGRKQMFEILAIVATSLITFFGYTRARDYVSSRLQYVEAVQSRKAAILAGIAAAVVASPLAMILPVIGLGTALLFGAGVGFGVAAGARQTRRRLSGW
jgi:hypothetical protein